MTNPFKKTAAVLALSTALVAAGGASAMAETPTHDDADRSSAQLTGELSSIFASDDSSFSAASAALLGFTYTSEDFSTSGDGGGTFSATDDSVAGSVGGNLSSSPDSEEEGGVKSDLGVDAGVKSDEDGSSANLDLGAKGEADEDRSSLDLNLDLRADQDSEEDSEDEGLLNLL